MKDWGVLCEKAELHSLLDTGLAEKEAGSGRAASDVFADLEKRFRFDADV